MNTKLLCLKGNQRMVKEEYSAIAEYFLNNNLIIKRKRTSRQEGTEKHEYNTIDDVGNLMTLDA